eukprot:756422-Hanusia_phi.AAC.1
MPGHSDWQAAASFEAAQPSHAPPVSPTVTSCLQALPVPRPRPSRSPRLRGAGAAVLAAPGACAVSPQRPADDELEGGATRPAARACNGPGRRMCPPRRSAACSDYSTP